MSFLDRLTDKATTFAAGEFRDMGHALTEIGEAMKNKVSNLPNQIDAATQQSAEKHLPKCTFGDWAGTVPRPCEIVPKATTPKEVPGVGPNKFGGPKDNPYFD